MSSGRRDDVNAASLVGLLAEDERLRAFAALVLGATNVDEVVRVSGLDARTATLALERLAAGGLVVDVERVGLRPVADRFKQAAQVEAKRRAEATPTDDYEGLSASSAAVMRNFVSGGTLRQIPANRAKRRVVLDWLAMRFEPGRTYQERDVNLMLGIAHDDVAALRRYLVDEGFLERRDGFYWRAGGTFEVD